MKTKGTEYLAEWNSTIQKLEKIENNIHSRLLFLSKENPNAVIGKMNYNEEELPLYAKNTLTEQYISTLNADTKIHYIIEIEKWIMDNADIKQLGFDF